MKTEFRIPDDVGYRQFRYAVSGVDKSGGYHTCEEEGKTRLNDPFADFGEMCLLSELKSKLRDICPPRALFGETRTCSEHVLAYIELDKDGRIVFEDSAIIKNPRKAINAWGGE